MTKGLGGNTLSRAAAGESSAGLDLTAIGLFATVVAFTFGSLPAIFGDGDVSWHVATGAWILDHRSVPSTDPFSFSAYGRPWVAHEWLADILWAMAVRTFGDSGLALLVSLSMAALFVIVGLEVRRFLRPPAVAVVLLALGMLLLPFDFARPHVLAWPLLAGWIVLLLHARERHGTPPMWSVGLMILWANLHGSYAIGIVLAALFALEALIEEGARRRVFLSWLGFGLLLLVGASLTPHGPKGLLYPIWVMRMTSLPFIYEWRPTDVVATLPFGPFLLATIAAIALPGAKVRPFRLAIVLGLLWMALSQMRQQPVWGITTILLLARPVAAAFHGEERERAPLWKSNKGRLRAMAALFALLAIFSTARVLIPVMRPESTANPKTAIAHIPPALRRQPVFNGYTFGGPLISAGVRPFIDGRADVYGDAFVEEFVSADSGDVAAWKRIVDRYHVVWAMTPPEHRSLIDVIARTPGWHRIYADRFAVIQVRDGPLAAPLPPLQPALR